MNEKTKGYIYGVVAAAAYGLNPLFAVPLYDSGMDVESVLFFRYLFAIPMVAVTLLARGRDFRVHSRETLPLIIMGILMALSSRTTSPDVISRAMGALLRRCSLSIL